MHLFPKPAQVLIGTLGLLLLLGTAVRESSAANPGVGPNTVTIVPYQAGDYRFQTIPLYAIPPSGFEQPGFNDSGFATGQAALGAGGGCPLQLTVHTTWPLNTELLVRKVVSIPSGATNVRIMLSVDNDIRGVFFNGTSITGFASHDGCPQLDDFRFDVPQSLVQAGQNLVAFHVLDRGGDSFFDARVLVDVAPTISATIAVKPGDSATALDAPKPINPRDKGVTPVAILTTSTLSAETVDSKTVRFGRTGTEAAPVHSSLKDVDGDGDQDMVLQFNTQETAIQCGDAVAHLSGKTVSGQMFKGSDSIKTPGCK
jgi:hypothetical protein